LQPDTSCWRRQVPDSQDFPAKFLAWKIFLGTRPAKALKIKIRRRASAAYGLYQGTSSDVPNEAVREFGFSRCAW
jgi:hypothetical protein